MRKFVLSLVTVLTVAAFAGTAMACPYSGHSSKDKKEVVVGS